ncbi:hypothetical protein, LTR Retrotransposon, partial [Trachipleistophora hominis]
VSHLITDHKALEVIRNKPEFDNNRPNRWCEAIQQYNFTIEYSKPVNLVEADALSRIHEKVKEPTEVNKKTEKRYETINEKHLCTVDGKNIGGLTLVLLEKSQRKKTRKS